MNPKRNTGMNGIKDRNGEILYEPEAILERWAEYVEELYSDNWSTFSDDIKTVETCTVTELEVQAIIQKLSRNKATGDDNIPAELIQALGTNGIQLITKLMNKIYNTGAIPDDYLKNIRKINNALNCSDFRTISLISHVSKILLQLTNARIAPTVSQLGFRKGRGIRYAIFQFRTIIERATQVNNSQH